MQGHSQHGSAGGHSSVCVREREWACIVSARALQVLYEGWKGWKLRQRANSIWIQEMHAWNVMNLFQRQADHTQCDATQEQSLFLECNFGGFLTWMLSGCLIELRQLAIDCMPSVNGCYTLAVRAQCCHHT
eukprot:586610-Pelagomonas_calceolata.AAC.2